MNLLYTDDYCCSYFISWMNSNRPTNRCCTPVDTVKDVTNFTRYNQPSPAISLWVGALSRPTVDSWSTPRDALSRVSVVWQCKDFTFFAICYCSKMFSHF